MAQKILIKKSTVAAKVPTGAQLDVGELAVNTADALLYTKHSDGSIKGLSTTWANVTDKPLTEDEITKLKALLATVTVSNTAVTFSGTVDAEDVYIRG